MPSPQAPAQNTDAALSFVLTVETVERVLRDAKTAANVASCANTLADASVRFRAAISPMDEDLTEFEAPKLTVTNYSGTTRFTQWSYKDTRAKFAKIISDGFFMHAWEMLSPGDMLLISAQDGGGMRYVARSNAGTVVLAEML